MTTIFKTALFNILSAFIVIMLITLSTLSFAEEPFITLPVTNTSLSNTDLNKVLEVHKGKVIYLDFWASWCGPCRKSFPWMNNIQSTLDPTKFTVISINVDQEKDLAIKFLEETPASFPVVYDPKGKAAKAYNIKGMPSSYLIDHKGNVVQSHTGFFTKKIKQYEDEINQLIALNVMNNVTHNITEK